jgi:short subunit fatty acids transporter
MQNKAIERGKVAETVTSVITSMLLIASAFAGFPGVAEGMAGSIAVQKSTVEAVKAYMPAGANLFTSYFIGMHCIVKATMSRDNT